MLRIVDVSNNNASVDFHALKAAGAVGVYLKVSEGTGFVDPTYKARYAAAKAAGLRVGGYHFGHPKNDPAQELSFFLSLLKLEKGDLKPALDLEVTDGQPAARVHTFAARFLHGLDAKIGELPVLYAGSPFMRANVLDVLPSRKWIPSYGARPAFFRWDAWQYTDGQRKYGAPIGGLDTSFVVSLSLMTYRASLVKRAGGHTKKALHGLLWYVNRNKSVPAQVWKRWWARWRRKHPGS